MMESAENNKVANKSAVSSNTLKALFNREEPRSG